MGAEGPPFPTRSWVWKGETVGNSSKLAQAATLESVWRSATRFMSDLHHQYQEQNLSSLAQWGGHVHLNPPRGVVHPSPSHGDDPPINSFHQETCDGKSATIPTIPLYYAQCYNTKSCAYLLCACIFISLSLLRSVFSFFIFILLLPVFSWWIKIFIPFADWEVRTVNTALLEQFGLPRCGLFTDLQFTYASQRSCGRTDDKAFEP